MIMMGVGVGSILNLILTGSLQEIARGNKLLACKHLPILNFWEV